MEKTKIENKLNRQLWAKSSCVSQEDGLNKIAEEIYQQIRLNLIQVAGYGLHSVKVSFGEGKGLTPTVWSKAVSLFPEMTDNILDRVKRLFEREEGVSPKIIVEHQIWEFDWRPSAAQLQMPRILSRDLIEMGYLPTGSIYKDILDALRMAIANDQVSADSTDAQKEWIRSNFSTLTI
jgi:hypothetical protein